MNAETAQPDGLRNHFLFSGLNDDERSHILAHSEVRDYRPGEIILEEGAHNSRLFIVLSGEVEVVKREPFRKMRLPIGTIREGGIFGDMSFMKGTPCSATVKAVGPVTFRVLDRKVFGSEPASHRTYNNLVTNMVGTHIDRLDTSNAKYVKSAVDYIEALQTQNEFGKFFGIVVITFGLGSIINRIVNDYVIDTTSNLFSWVYLLILLLPVLFFVVYFKYSLATFGVTLENWKPSVHDGLLSGGLGVVLFLGGYWVTRQMAGKPLEHSLWVVVDPRLLGPTLILYLFHSYLQEFIARGVIQTSLQKFLADATGRQAVMFTSFLFAVFHLHISIVFSFIVFVASVLFGLLYLRTKNLIGVSTLHWLLGLCTIHTGLM